MAGGTEDRARGAPRCTGTPARGVFMSFARVRVSLVVCAWLASIAGTARAQISPAPPTGGAPAVDAPTPPPAPAPLPAPAPPTAPAPAASPAAPATRSLDPAAAKAGATGGLVEVTDPDAVRHCRDLGEEAFYTSRPGARGRLGLREALKEIGRARGASHIQYSGYVVLADSNAQRERGRFFDCTISRVAPPALAPPQPEPQAPQPSFAPRASYGGQLDVFPVGSLRAKANTPGLNTPALEGDIVTAYGVSGNFEYIVTPEVALGVNPGVVLGLKGPADTTSDTEYDVRARVRVGKLVGDGLGAHLYAGGGVSWLVMPGDVPTSVGAVFEFGAGVSHPVDSSTFVTFELGYQFGFQSATISTVDIEAASRLFHIGLGISTYL